MNQSRIMKATFIVITAPLLFGQAFLVESLKLPEFTEQHKYITQNALTPGSQINTPHSGPAPIKRMCPYCVHFAKQTSAELLNIILNIGVIGSCKQLCDLLPVQTGSKALKAQCGFFCSKVGIQSFTSIIMKSDLDAIYMCELLKMCRIFDDGDATITSFTITPESSPQGIFNLDVRYTSENGTGTGQVKIDVRTIDQLPVGESFFQGPTPAGSFHLSFKLKAKVDPSCDPTKGPCEKWLAGNYSVETALCNRVCGSTSPHSSVYDKARAFFTIDD